MLRLIPIALVLAAAPAIAQTPSANDTVTLKLPRAMVQQIGNALMDAPYKTSAPIMLELQRQLSEPDQAAPKPPPPAAEPSPPGH
jgi:hypothetical protein